MLGRRRSARAARPASPRAEARPGLLARVFRRAPAEEAPPVPHASTAPALPDILRQVRRIELRTRGLVSSRFSGEYHSVFKGQGLEFTEVRQYLPGDDVRTIDWNVSARTGEVFVKKYVEERELTVLLMVDLSGSQHFGTRGRFKSETVAEVAATLAMSAVRNNDRVGLLVFTDRVELFVPPRKGRRHVLRLVRDLLTFRPEGTATDLAGALEYSARLSRSRSILFLVSDFQGGLTREAERALTRASLRHDLIPIVVTDPADLELPDAGMIQVVDPETGARVVVDSGNADVRDRYAEMVRDERAGLRKTFRRLGMDEIELRTDQPTSTAVLSFFRRRERRLRR